MKRICLVNSNTVWGGGEKWHYAMALRLHALGWHVAVVTNVNSALHQRLRASPVVVYPLRISNLSFLNFATIWKLSRFLKQQAIDSVLCNLPADMKVGGLAARLAGVPQIIYRRGMPLPVRNTWLNRFFFQHILTDLIVNSTEMMRNMLPSDANWLSPQQIHLIYNGIDLEAYDREPTIPVYVRRGSEIVLGNAGRLVAQKGQQYLIDLAERLKVQGLNFKLLIAGTGELEAQLKQFAHDRNVADEVMFLGFVEPIKGFMESLDIFVFPSLFEGLGNVLIEAMVSCKPIVAFDLSSNPEVIVHGQTGFLVESGDMDAFMRRVIELSADARKREEFGQEARQRVTERFTFENTVAQVLAVLEQRSQPSDGRAES